MKAQSWKIYAVIAILICLISVFIDWRFTLGYILGVAESLIQYKRIEIYWNQVVDVGVVTKHTGSSRFFSHYLLIALMFLICSLLPNVFNIFGCALGMLMIKVTTVVEELLHRGGLV